MTQVLDRGVEKAVCECRSCNCSCCNNPANMLGLRLVHAVQLLRICMSVLVRHSFGGFPEALRHHVPTLSSAKLACNA
jgi:hypothetical protein